MKSLLIIMAAFILLPLSISLSLDIHPQLLKELEYAGWEPYPIIKVDNRGILHLLFARWNPEADYYGEHEFMYYYRYSLPDYKIVHKYYDDNLGGVKDYYFDLNVSEEGCSYIIYGGGENLAGYQLPVMYLLRVDDKGEQKKFSVGPYSAVWNSVLPGCKFWFALNLALYAIDRNSDIYQINNPSHFGRHLGIPPFVLCDNILIPEIIGFDSIKLYILDYCVDLPRNDRDRYESCREHLGVLVYDLKLDSLIKYTEFDLFSDPQIRATELPYDQISVYKGNHSTINILIGRAHPGGPGRMCKLTIDTALNPIETGSIQTRKMEENLSFTDPTIDHQLFWFKQSDDSSYVGTFTRYVVVGDMIYHSTSEPIFARGLTEVRQKRKALQEGWK